MTKKEGYVVGWFDLKVYNYINNVMCSDERKHCGKTANMGYLQHVLSCVGKI